MTLVLMKSYEGNLVSLLAVRHVPQPYQTVKDVLQNPSTSMVWQKGSSHLELIRVCIPMCGQLEASKGSCNQSPGFESSYELTK